MLNLFRRTPRGRTLPLEEQLQVLASCGITLAPGVTSEALALSFGPSAFEADPFWLALAVMGSEAEGEAQAGPNGYPSDNVWHFDRECIEDHGAYAAIADRLRTLAQGDLPLEEIEDYVDLEEGSAWVGFRLDGRQYRWAAEVQDDWVDWSILSRFAALLSQRGLERRFTYVDLGGQDCLIGCATPEEKAALQNRTGLQVDWLG